MKQHWTETPWASVFVIAVALFFVAATVSLHNLLVYLGINF